MQLVGEERRWICDDVGNLGLELRAIIALRDDVLDDLVRVRGRFTGRHAEAN